MPDSNTFDIPIIGDWVKWHLFHSKVSIDPFARNKRWATHTNDLNPATAAEHHLEAIDFLNLLRDREVKADLFIFDPPYSPRQLKECYDNVGKKMQMEDGQTARLKSLWREAAMPLLTCDATVLSFGWNTCGMGDKHGFQPIEIMICDHGGDHNATLCLSEKRRATESAFDL